VSRFVELAHPIRDGMAAFPGLPPAKVGALLTHEESRDRYEGIAEFLLGKVELACNTGTYLDAPFHRFRDREDLASIALDRMAGLPGIVVEPADPDAREVLLVGLEPADVRGRAVLVRTGRSELWGSDAYWDEGPFLSGKALDLLIGGGAVLVGVDFGNVDDTGDPSRPAHTRLLAGGALIVENLTGLGALPREGFTFFAAPLRIEGGAAFPVRAFAMLPDAPG
jgi:kynurenine formamidase